MKRKKITNLSTKKAETLGKCEWCQRNKEKKVRSLEPQQDQKKIERVVCARFVTQSQFKFYCVTEIFFFILNILTRFILTRIKLIFTLHNLLLLDALPYIAIQFVVVFAALDFIIIQIPAYVVVQLLLFQFERCVN